MIVENKKVRKIRIPFSELERLLRDAGVPILPGAKASFRVVYDPLSLEIYSAEPEDPL